MSEHAAIGPSSLHRLLACPGSHNLCKGVPEGASSVFAAEGTCAHWICEEVLNGRANEAKNFMGQKLTFDGFDFVVDQEMVDGCNMYVNHCGAISDTKGVKAVEDRVYLDKLWEGEPPEPIFGTADYVFVSQDKTKLSVCDLKYGRKPVDPTENPQAMAYALGAVFGHYTEFENPPQTVDIYIVQPRGTDGSGVKHWQTTGLDLLMWGYDVLKTGVADMVRPDALLNPGDHCLFCPKKPTCSALKQLAQKASRTEFNPIPPKPENLTDDELTEILDRADVLKMWIDAVRSEASQRLDRGADIPGYKLVPKRAVRRWGPEQDVRERLEGLFSDKADYTKETLRTPTQLEKLLPKDAYAGLVEDGLITKTSSGTTLVADHDPRDALIQKRAADEFSQI